MAEYAYSTTFRNTIVDAGAAVFDGGSIDFREADEDVVANCAYSATAYGDAADGEAEANAIADGVSAAGGVVDHVNHLDSLDASHIEGDASDTEGTGAMKMSSLTVGPGDTVRVVSQTMSMPATLTV